MAERYLPPQQEVDPPDWPVRSIIGIMRLDGQTRVTYAGADVPARQFSYNQHITHLHLPNATAIHSCAFLMSPLLEEVYAPMLEDIGRQAFAYCAKLVTVFAPNASRIGYEAFTGCTSLRAADLPKVEVVKVGAFNGCRALTVVRMPVLRRAKKMSFNNCGIEEFDAPQLLIGDVAISMNNTLRTVDFRSMQTFGENSFHHCQLLVDIDLPSLLVVAEELFMECTGLERASFASAHTIETWAFFKCTNLVRVDVPSVREIGLDAFYQCVSLREVVLPPSLTKMAPRVFNGCTLSLLSLSSMADIGHFTTATILDLPPGHPQEARATPMTTRLRPSERYFDSWRTHHSASAASKGRAAALLYSANQAAKRKRLPQPPPEVMEHILSMLPRHD
jgi:hypothetical protein